jgi:hypothetical protein
MQMLETGIVVESDLSGGNLAQQCRVDLIGMDRYPFGAEVKTASFPFFLPFRTL